MFVVPNTAASAANPHRLVLLPQLKTEFGVPYSRMHLYRLVKAGQFPAPIRISSNRIAWRASSILAWIDAREMASLGMEVRHAA
ncbi:helix-turn-helix transcriptional regulator [Paraburkholderia adhaesiva]|uniref:helix-turn-helix transcriptional regulator n=1 Tax=Paraburkholderia adhaesiva TaxID=2883244 RepID=UPI001F44EE88|nr:AlpA family phage regulatory protein [Paraburkholderia adhaesiva]